MYSRAPAPPPISVFCLHPSPAYPNSLLINIQRVNISPTQPPSPSLHLPSPDSPQPSTKKSHFLQHFSPYFSRHSPSLANSKIGHRTGEGIFVKAFTLYALIYCTLRSIGEGVKAKIENRLTCAREGNPKNTSASPCRLSPKQNIRLAHFVALIFDSSDIWSDGIQ